MTRQRQTTALVGRERECAVVDRLLAESARGRGRVLVVRGAPGIGKTALLDHAAERAAGATVLRVTGLEQESDLGFAGLHWLLRPLDALLRSLPASECGALAAAVGLGRADEERPTDRFRVAAQLLGLISRAAGQSWVVVLVDDAQWLDRPSLDALLFAARRLADDRVAVLIAVRDEGADDLQIPGAEEMTVGALPEADAAELLSRSGAGLSPQVRGRLLREAAGNPLALLEFPAALSQAQLSGRDPLPEPVPLTPRIRRMFQDRIQRLDEDCRAALVLAAVDDTGDLGVVLRAASLLGLPPDALDAAESAPLIDLTGGRIVFRHPLVRATVHDGSTSGQRRRAHMALAGALVARDHDERRIWHRALAAVDVDEDTAAELETVARWAARRAAHASAATALLQAADLSPRDADRLRRTAAAAEAAWAAGQTDRARAAARRALAGADRDLSARMLSLTGVIEYRTGRLTDACDQLLQAARAETDPSRKLEILINAAGAAFSAGDAGRLGTLAAATRDVAPRTARDRLIVALVRGHAALAAQEHREARESLTAAVAAAGEVDDPRALMWAARAQSVTFGMGSGLPQADRAVRAARADGLIGLLPLALSQQSADLIGVGAYDLACAAAEEGDRLASELGQSRAAHLNHLAMIAAVRGRRDEAVRTAKDALARARHTGSTYHLGLARWAMGCADLYAGDPGRAAQQLVTVASPDHTDFNPVVGFAAMPDAVEACARAGDRTRAGQLLDTYAAWVAANPHETRDALLAYCETVVHEDTDDDRRARVLRLAAALSPLHRGRCELSHGEWLRRRRRPHRARAHLRTAHELFSAVGAVTLAERAASELRAAGDAGTGPEPAGPASERLTPQELQIAMLVAQGLTNPQIAAQLFLSPRTIDYHLHKVFRKLGLSSRTQLVRYPRLLGP